METGKPEIRPLTPSEFEAVVELDRKIMGASRPQYFKTRLDAALRSPRRHVQVAASDARGLVGFVLARRAGGEYGRDAPALVLEALGVHPELQRAGLGQRMLAAAEAVGLKERGDAPPITRVVTQVEWKNHGMLRFLAGANFSLVPVLTLERSVLRSSLGMGLLLDDGDLVEPPIVRRLRDSDAPMLVQIDRLVSGRDRGDYIRRKVDEALNESAICVSLVVEDGGFAVGFAIARVDVGEFGHMVPTASLDTVGVRPDLGRRGFGRALLSQLMDNLSALHVEDLRTEVGWNEHALLRFLQHGGFGPSQRLSFEKRL